MLKREGRRAAVADRAREAGKWARRRLTCGGRPLGGRRSAVVDLVSSSSEKLRWGATLGQADHGATGEWVRRGGSDLKAVGDGLLGCHRRKAGRLATAESG
ncbi:hypothetical protein MLD38_037609 [Melastoma candidum]|uniref:Uncharacterized protein n=1 Tax=Melastoma candidum TaxID=119954 RepID=A0ACB9LP87_9MYRT|nr:hypothetical protein MLD38_037609 [Melastoma candidum]